MVTISIKAIFDPTCPWCYVGAVRLTRAIEAYRKTVCEDDVIKIAWNSFQIDPDAVTQPILKKMASRFGRDQVPRMQEQLLEMGKKDGLHFSMESTVGNTRDAHRLVQLAKTKSDSDQEQLSSKLVLEIMKMYFEEGGDITSFRDLGLAAERAGIDKREAVAWLVGGGGAEEFRREVEEGRSLGIRGVPWFQFNGQAVVRGATEESGFLRELVLAREHALKVLQNNATLGSTAILGQETITKASIKARVKHYVLVDWGALTTDPKVRALPINYLLIRSQELLKKKADEGVLEYTISSVGALLDYVLDFPFILVLKTSSIQLYDVGEHAFSSTSVHSVGKAISGAPEATKNQKLLIHDTILTQAKVFAFANKYSPPTVQWTETRVDAQQDLEHALKNLEKNPTDFNLIFPLLKAALFSGKYRAAYPQVDNELVGLPLLTVEELENKFAAKFHRA